MSGTFHKAKLKKYIVTIRRDVEQVAVLEIEARNSEEAEDMARNVIDNDPTRWSAGTVVAQDAKAKVIR